MEVIPSIDISRGRCVKRVRGEDGTGLVLGDPVEQAVKWVDEGARRLHVVDLDGAALGKPINMEVIRKILERIEAPVQVGGGIRSIEHAAGYIESGARWIILGTSIIENPTLLQKLIEELGSDKIIAALDYDEHGYLVKRGWRQKTEVKILDYARRLDSLNLSAFLCTYTPLEGTLRGVDVETVKILAGELDTPIIYAGGIRDLSDLKILKEVGVAGVVIGMALYLGRISLSEAIKACR